MNQMHRQSLVAYGQPLCETVADCPSPRGGEVLVRVERCGVCHSDLHLQDGYFSLGAEKKLDVSAGARARRSWTVFASKFANLRSSLSNISIATRRARS
jgi:NADPH:quinone reductase-like Zn-dependent oxidoreductase